MLATARSRICARRQECEAVCAKRIAKRRRVYDGLPDVYISAAPALDPPARDSPDLTRRHNALLSSRVYF